MRLGGVIAGFAFLAACSRPSDEPLGASKGVTSSSAASPASGSAPTPQLALGASVSLPVGQLALESAMLPSTDAGPPTASATPAGSASANAPSLPVDAPKQVVFGVALVTYRGAQGATPSARSREEALSLAERIADTAREDFAAAVRLADVGFENAGSMPRGVLEPAAEQVLFGLEVGQSARPVDSPRGYYVFKRLP